jgi:hypothetical protein
LKISQCAPDIAKISRERERKKERKREKERREREREKERERKGRKERRKEGCLENPSGVGEGKGRKSVKVLMHSS